MGKFKFLLLLLNHFYMFVIMSCMLVLSLSSERAASSPSESAVIVTSAVECLRYCILHNAQDDEGQKKICSILVSQQVRVVCFLNTYIRCPLKSLIHYSCVLQLLPLLETALGSPSLQNGPLFLLVTEMLVSWEKRAGLHSTVESLENSDIFKGLVAEFWEGLALLFVHYVDSDKTDPKAFDGMATLLQVSVALEKTC